jgi:hypothetical protein
MLTGPEEEEKEEEEEEEIMNISEQRTSEYGPGTIQSRC